MQVGEKVVCVKVGGFAPQLVKGEIYSVHGVFTCPCGDGTSIDIGLTLGDVGSFYEICLKCKLTMSEGASGRLWINAQFFRPIVQIGDEVESWCEEVLWKQVELERSGFVITEG